MVSMLNAYVDLAKIDARCVGMRAVSPAVDSLFVFTTMNLVKKNYLPITSK